jgi:hypothetical protein
MIVMNIKPMTIVLIEHSLQNMMRTFVELTVGEMREGEALDQLEQLVLSINIDSPIGQQ